MTVDLERDQASQGTPPSTPRLRLFVGLDSGRCAPRVVVGGHRRGREEVIALETTNVSGSTVVWQSRHQFGQSDDVQRGGQHDGYIGRRRRPMKRLAMERGPVRNGTE